jgi:hypothetical protein
VEVSVSKYDPAADSGIGHEHILHYALPGSLRSLRLFEDFNEDMMDIFDQERRDAPMPGMDFFRIPNREVGWELARRSQPLEHVAASFVVDAYDFFPATDDRRWTWNKLKSLSMTTRKLGFPGWRELMNKMLLRASAGLKRMPKLKILEIWNGGRGVASLFRYEVDEGGATLTWGYNRDVYLDDDVVKAWKRQHLSIAERSSRLIASRSRSTVFGRMGTQSAAWGSRYRFWTRSRRIRSV